MRTPFRVGLLVLSLLAACQSVQQTATSPDYHKTRAGAGIGAAIGGAIGNSQDRPQRALRTSTAGSGVAVVRASDNITLNMPGGITFASTAPTSTPTSTRCWTS